jgi:hypothetical protein
MVPPLFEGVFIFRRQYRWELGGIKYEGVQDIGAIKKPQPDDRQGLWTEGTDFFSRQLAKINLSPVFEGSVFKFSLGPH